jgi:hypothetical protein
MEWKALPFVLTDHKEVLVCGIFMEVFGLFASFQELQVFGIGFSW